MNTLQIDYMHFLAIVLVTFIVGIIIGLGIGTFNNINSLQVNYNAGQLTGYKRCMKELRIE